MKTTKKGKEKIILEKEMFFLCPFVNVSSWEKMNNCLKYNLCEALPQHPFATTSNFYGLHEPDPPWPSVPHFYVSDSGVCSIPH